VVGGAATQTFAPGGKYPRAATANTGVKIGNVVPNQKLKYNYNRMKREKVLVL